MNSLKNTNAAILSVDVEDWFHILDVAGAPPVTDWAVLPSRVERNFRVLLELFAENNVRITCFFLGWVAQRFPQLVRDAADQGHEIASHGFIHQLVSSMTQQEFRKDCGRSRKLLEDISGRRVSGFRAPGFSATQQTPWFFDEIALAGYLYDSSIFPAPHGHGGIKGANKYPHVVPGTSGICEFPITVQRVLGREMCFFGGGYLRLTPYWLIRSMAKKVQDEDRPVIFYVHPRELDPEHPRLPMNPVRKFKSYVNLSSTVPKLQSILKDFSVTSFDHYLRMNPDKFENSGWSSDSSALMEADV